MEDAAEGDEAGDRYLEATTRSEAGAQAARVDSSKESFESNRMAAYILVGASACLATGAALLAFSDKVEPGDRQRLALVPVPEGGLAIWEVVW